MEISIFLIQNVDRSGEKAGPEKQMLIGYMIEYLVTVFKVNSFIFEEITNVNNIYETLEKAIKNRKDR